MASTPHECEDIVSYLAHMSQRRISMTFLVHELVSASAIRAGDSPAITSGGKTHSYSALLRDIERFASGLRALGLDRGQRVAVYLDKRVETGLSPTSARVLPVACSYR